MKSNENTYYILCVMPHILEPTTYPVCKAISVICSYIKPEVRDRALRDIEPTDVAEGPSKSTEYSPNTEMQSSTMREGNPFTNRPLPPLPQLAAENAASQSAEIENQNIEDAEIPY